MGVRGGIDGATLRTVTSAVDCEIEEASSKIRRVRVYSPSSE